MRSSTKHPEKSGQAQSVQYGKRDTDGRFVHARWASATKSEKNVGFRIIIPQDEKGWLGPAHATRPKRSVPGDE